MLINIRSKFSNIPMIKRYKGLLNLNLEICNWMKKSFHASLLRPLGQASGSQLIFEDPWLSIR